MAWKGFLTESKFYMSYPGYARDGLNYYPGNYRPSMSDEQWAEGRPGRRRCKIKFWSAFPKAAIRFYWYMLKDYFINWRI